MGPTSPLRMNIKKAQNLVGISLFALLNLKIDLDPALIPNCIDELPILSIAMMYVEGTSIISGAEEPATKKPINYGDYQATRCCSGVYEEMEDAPLFAVTPHSNLIRVSFKVFMTTELPWRLHTFSKRKCRI